MSPINETVNDPIITYSKRHLHILFCSSREMGVFAVSPMKPMRHLYRLLPRPIESLLQPSHKAPWCLHTQTHMLLLFNPGLVLMPLLPPQPRPSPIRHKGMPLHATPPDPECAPQPLRQLQPPFHHKSLNSTVPSGHLL
jgi:hypothetical protein